MNNLPEQMAEAHHNNGFGTMSRLFHWDTLTDASKAGHIADMKAALEVLKSPPEEFLEAMVVRVYRKINMCSEKETMQAALIAAIEQTLKDDEDD